MKHNTPLTEDNMEEVGQAVGLIIEFAARALHTEFGLDLEDLLRTFTRPACIEVVATFYLHGLHQGQSSAAAAAEASVELIYAWADTRLEAKAIVAQRHAADALLAGDGE
ncbi:hypothetical protein ACH4UT_23710 [Streptomyces sp. NPDC020799]|uniref:hypothetical protein n=1 Tax=Streptomyces sp. NPDC020799 TaxID=3365091 RepID=UPI00347D35E6